MNKAQKEAAISIKHAAENIRHDCHCILGEVVNNSIPFEESIIRIKREIVVMERKLLKLKKKEPAHECTSTD